MKIEIIKSTVAKLRTIAAGAVVEVTDKEGHFLINTGRAVRIDEPAKKKISKKKKFKR